MPFIENYSRSNYRIYCSEYSRRFRILNGIMQRRLRQTPFEDYALKFELLEALRQSLKDLENLRLVPQNDPHVEGLKQHLRKKIRDLEYENSENFEALLAA